MNISSISSSSFSGVSCAETDSEAIAIRRKLIAIGITPTGNKAADRTLLHKAELEQVKQEIGNNPNAAVSAGKYITISSSEIENIQAKQKENKPVQNKFENNEKAQFAGAEAVADYNKYLIMKNKKKRA